MDDEARLADYLLGRLPDEEQARLEEEYLADPEVQERLLAVEDDLIDAYVTRRLSAAERERLEAGLLASERGQRKLELVRTLASHAAALRDAGAGAPHRRPMLLRWAAVAVLFVAPIVAWSVWRPSAPTPQAPPTVQTTLPEGHPAQQVAAITLAPLSRDAAAPSTLRIGRDVERIHVTLTLDGQPHQRYSVVLLDGLDAVKWSARGVERHAGESRAALVLDLPSALFQSGEYAFLIGPDAQPDRTIASYSLTIEKN
jgi:hypothetical protein